MLSISAYNYINLIQKYIIICIKKSLLYVLAKLSLSYPKNIKNILNFFIYAKSRQMRLY